MKRRGIVEHSLAVIVCGIVMLRWLIPVAMACGVGYVIGHFAYKYW